MRNGEVAFKRFFKGLSKYPKLKKKNKEQQIKAYFPRNSSTDWVVDRHRIKIPTLGYVHIVNKSTYAQCLSDFFSLLFCRVYFSFVSFKQANHPQ